MITMEVELVARNSFSSTQKSMDENYNVPFSHIQDWSWSHLRVSFEEKMFQYIHVAISRTLSKLFKKPYSFLHRKNSNTKVSKDCT